MKRMRGRNHRSGGGGGGGFRNQQNGIPLNRNHVFDSSGPEMRVRGTAQQLYEKYTQLARDAVSSVDRVLSEAYYQHAEHYFRILIAINAAQGLPPPGQSNPNGEPRYNNPNQGEYQRREPGAEGEPQEVREPRQETRQEPRQENRENREFRDNRQERRFEPRNNNRQDFQPRERQERQDRPYRPAAPIADTPIDISSALEAELRAAANEGPAGVGEQPEVKATAKAEAPAPAAPEARAIPIKPEAPPISTPELTLTEPEAKPAPKRRGRPPRAKAVEPAKAE